MIAPNRNKRQQYWNNQNQNIQALKQEIEVKNQQLDAKKNAI